MELEAMGSVADRLVGGMMTHSDHADLMHFLGLSGFARLHEDGYAHDAKSLREVRRKCILHLGRIPHQGEQRRPTPTKAMGHHRSDLSANDRYRLATESLKTWAEWESETAKVFGEAAQSLDGTLWRLVDKLQRGAETEAVEAEELLMEAMSCDMAHVYDMQ